MTLTPSEALAAIREERQLAIHEERRLSAGAVGEILDSVDGADGLSEASVRHFEQLLEECCGNLRDGDQGVAIVNLTHAIQVVLGVDDDPTGAVPQEIRARLDAIVRLSGGLG